jgi:signal peptidase I
MGNGEAQTLNGWIRTFALGRSPQWTLVRVAVLVVTTFILFKYVVLLRKIESISMVPTLREGSIHLINRLAYNPNRGPRRGDIVGIRTSGETVMYVKRVVGLPGESVEIRDGRVLINGEELEEPYVRPRRQRWNWPLKPPRPRVLGSDEYFIIGDNRSMGQDLHDFGIVKAQRVVGKLIW